MSLEPGQESSQEGCVPPEPQQIKSSEPNKKPNAAVEEMEQETNSTATLGAIDKNVGEISAEDNLNISHDDVQIKVKDTDSTKSIDGDNAVIMNDENKSSDVSRANVIVKQEKDLDNAKIRTLDGNTDQDNDMKVENIENDTENLTNEFVDSVATTSVGMGVTIKQEKGSQNDLDPVVSDVDETQILNRMSETNSTSGAKQSVNSSATNDNTAAVEPNFVVKLEPEENVQANNNSSITNVTRNDINAMDVGTNKTDSNSAEGRNTRAGDALSNLSVYRTGVRGGDSDGDSGTADSDADSDDSSSSSSTSSAESDDESSDSGNDASSSSEAQDLPSMRRKCGEDDDDDVTSKHLRPLGNVRTKGEFTMDDLPPLEALKITLPEDVVMEKIGTVSSIIDVLVVVQGKRGLPALDADTFVFLEGQKLIGQIFETFGPVPAPLYSIRFNKVEDITSLGIEVGKAVFYVPMSEQFTRYVFVEQLRRLKGSDASWEHNNEPPAKFLDYSDDEEEKRAKARHRGKDISADDERTEDGTDEHEHHQGKRRRKKKKHGFEGGQPVRWRGGRGGHSVGRGGYGPSHIAQWPPQPRFYRPRHGQYQHHNRPPHWSHYGGGGPRFPYGHPAAPHRGPRPVGVPLPPPASTWSAGAPGLMAPGQLIPQTSVPAWAVPTPPSGWSNNSTAGSTITNSCSVTPQLDTRFVQNSSLQPSPSPVSTLGGATGARPQGGTGAGPPPVQVFPFGPPQFGGTPNFSATSWTSHGFSEQQ